jgi:hypothetical protein
MSLLHAILSSLQPAATRGVPAGTFREAAHAVSARRLGETRVGRSTWLPVGVVPPNNDPALAAG